MHLVTGYVYWCQLYTWSLSIFNSIDNGARTHQVHSFDAQEGAEHDCMC
jgi:hypothetical protein